MTPVFFCTIEPYGVPTIRAAMRNLCFARWTQEVGEGELKVLTPGGQTGPSRFQRNRRIDADRLSDSDIYVCADDDCLLPDTPCLEEAVKTLEEYPEFGILSFWPSNSTLGRWTPEKDERERVCVGATVFEDDRVMEHVSVGGIRVCRKGLLTEWPPMHEGSRSYDSEHCQALREAGYRSGYFKGLLFNHLGRGRGYSQVAS